MSYELLHFRNSDRIITEKNLTRDVNKTLRYLDEVVHGAKYRREIMRLVMEETGWVNGNSDALRVLQNRGYRYKGLKKGVAICGNFARYEVILEELLRLQIGYDHRRLDMGIIVLTAKRAESSHYGKTANLVKSEIQELFPTINLPVSIALFDIAEAEIVDFPEEENYEEIAGPDEKAGVVFKTAA